MSVGRLRSQVFLGVLLTVGMLMSTMAEPIHAATHIVPGATIEADPETVRELMAAFDQAEDAIKQKNLDRLMTFYATDYNYHGLTKADIRKIWQDLFDNYKDIGSTHMFALIRVSGPSSAASVEITCSGSLYVTSDVTKLRIPIDSWYQEVHFLVKEKGSWRIRGNVGDTPKVMPFGTAPHPLF